MKQILFLIVIVVGLTGCTTKTYIPKQEVNPEMSSSSETSEVEIIQTEETAVTNNSVAEITLDDIVEKFNEIEQEEAKNDVSEKPKIIADKRVYLHDPIIEEGSLTNETSETEEKYNLESETPASHNLEFHMPMILGHTETIGYTETEEK